MASFTKPVKETSIMEKSDFTHGMFRTEVRSSKANSHLVMYLMMDLKSLEVLDIV